MSEHERDYWAHRALHADHEHQDIAARIVESLEYNLVAMLKPTIAIDGNQWCVLYGENLHDGIAGFGDTPYLAVLAFNKEWDSKLPEPPHDN